MKCTNQFGCECKNCIWQHDYLTQIDIANTYLNTIERYLDSKQYNKIYTKMEQYKKQIKKIRNLSKEIFIELRRLDNQ